MKFRIFHGSTAQFGKRQQREILLQDKVLAAQEYFVYSHGVCRIRKPSYAGNGCAIFQAAKTARLGQKIRWCPQTQLCGVAA